MCVPYVFLDVQDGTTGIMAAVHKGHKDVVELLLSSGVDVNHRKDKVQIGL